MDEKKKEELREVADQFKFLKELILARMENTGGSREVYDVHRSTEQIAGRIIAARVLRGCYGYTN